MPNNISVTGNNLVYTGQLNSDAKFEADANAGQVTNNNYGAIESVTVLENGDYQVKTDKGTMTFDADVVSLEDAKELQPYELASTTFPEFKGSKINWMELSAIVMEAEKMRRKENRDERASNREAAFNKGIEAANKKLEGAEKAYATAMVTGAITAAGGAVSVAGGLSGAGKAAKAMKVKTKTVGLKADLATTTNDLTKTRSDISKLNKKVQPLSETDSVKLQKLEAKEVKLAAKQERLLKKVDDDIAKLEVSTAKDQKKLDEIDAKIEAVPNKTSVKGKAKIAFLQFKKANLEKALDSDLQSVSTLQKAKSDAKAVDAAESDDAKLVASAKFEQTSRAEFDSTQAELQKYNTDMQQRTQWINGATAMTQGDGSMIGAAGRQGEAEDIHEAEILQVKAQKDASFQEEANAQFQDANRAIDAFQKAWAQYLDSVKATQDRLVQA